MGYKLYKCQYWIGKSLRENTIRIKVRQIRQIYQFKIEYVFNYVWYDLHDISEIFRRW